MTKAIFSSITKSLCCAVAITAILLSSSNAHSEKLKPIRLDPIQLRAICGCFAWKGDKLMADNLIFQASGRSKSNSYYQRISLKLNGNVVDFKLLIKSTIAKYHNPNKLRKVFNDILTSKLYRIKSEWKTTKIFPSPDGNQSYFDVKFFITNTHNNASTIIDAKGYCGC